jgi:Holliday junction resolvase RusA-like endonuclease
MIQFFIPGPPVAKGRPRVASIGGHARAYTPSKTQRAETCFLAQALAHKPATPLTGPLAVSVLLALPVPASWPKKRKEEALEGLRYPTGRPDCDNLAKLVLDALNGVFWGDDAQIVNLRVTKTYAVGVPGTTVTVDELTPGQGE